MPEPVDTSPDTGFPPDRVLYGCAAIAFTALSAGGVAVLAGHGSDFLALAVAVLFLLTPNRWEPR